MRLSRLLAILFVLVFGTNAARILFVAPVLMQSHFILVYRLAKELLRKGYEVTMISNHPGKDPLENYTEIIVDDLGTSFEDFRVKMMTHNQQTLVGNLLKWGTFSLDLTEKTLANSKVQKFLKSNETFDLVILEHFFNEAFFGFGYRFNAPVITMSSTPSGNLNNYLVGNPAPSSYAASMGGVFSQTMTFGERFQNFFYGQLHGIIREFIFLPRHRKLFERYISTALVFDKIIYNPLPKVSAIVEIGGFHIQTGALPLHLKQFLDDSPEGVVLFSMGTSLKSEDLKPEVITSILSVFSKRKMKLLWKYGGSLENAPDNVKTMEWVPQSEVLAHPNVKVFITHGGLLSVIEGIYHGVPMIGVPIYGDQKHHTARAVQNGIALVIEITDITEESLSKTLDEILENQSYLENVKHRSTLLKDQPISPLDLAVYWVEHVLRYNGAPHLRCASLELSWLQRHQLDVILILVLCFYMTVFVIKKCLTAVTPKKDELKKQQ